MARRTRTSGTSWCVLGALLLAAQAAPAQPATQPATRPTTPPTGQPTPQPPAGFGYQPGRTTDALGREIIYYLSSNAGDEPKPLVLFVQGSGCGSVFGRTGSGQIYGGLQNLILKGFGDRARVLVVEKPGVAFCDQQDQPGTAEGCSEEFLREHTADRWAEALRAGLADALAQGGVDRSRVLVIGHSEGADMAAHVGALAPELVTHVAVLSGAGITQLFDMVELAWAETEPGEPTRARQARVDSILNTYRDIRQNPDSTTDLAWGHPHRRWSSFMGASPADSLVKIKDTTPMFLAHGTADQSCPIASFDAAVSQLLVAGASPVIRRIPDADHGFATPGDTGHAGLDAILSEALVWFLDGEGAP
ncbi:MAG: prolyl oligopeptidase family serine peptidase [Phycisphaerales bacterium]|nr:prolyl oligopeptidase family serine peptidase [Phycisphaerales bacterium]